ncbi:Uncharacterised protein [Chlamydia abortus]|nr:Uncharacterised protein [Chlamydia abortus]
MPSGVFGDGFNITLMLAEVSPLQVAVTDSVKIPEDNTFIVFALESSIFKYLSDIGVLFTLSGCVCSGDPSPPAAPLSAASILIGAGSTGLGTLGRGVVGDSSGFTTGEAGAAGGGAGGGGGVDVFHSKWSVTVVSVEIVFPKKRICGVEILDCTYSTLAASLRSVSNGVLTFFTAWLSIFKSPDMVLPEILTNREVSGAGSSGSGTSSSGGFS